MRLFVKKNLTIIVCAPICINFLTNLYLKPQEMYILSVNIYEYISLGVASYFFYKLGILVSNILKIRSSSLGVVIFLLSFFIFENFLLGFKLLFNQTFFIVLSFWFVVLFKLSNKYDVLKVTIYFLFQFFFNRFFIDKFIKNNNLIGDVEALWFPTAKNIYEQGYFFSLVNSPFEGYGQLVSYTQSLVYKIMFGLDNFVYFSNTTRLFLVLMVLFFLEFDIRSSSKILSIITYLSLILNNSFWGFLFSESLMAEGISSYMFSVFIYNISQKIESNNFTINLLLFSFGFLFLSKQFFSTFVIIFLIYFGLFKATKVGVLLGFICIILNYLNYRFILSDLTTDPYLSQIDIYDTILDLILFRDLELYNLVSIVKNIYIDKPLVYFLIVFIFLIIYKLLVKKSFINETYMLMFFSVLNIIFILLLYISAWRNMELESPVRFIVAFIYLKSIFIFNELENYNK